MGFDIQDVEHEIALIGNLQRIQEDIDIELMSSRHKNNDLNFAYDYDYYKEKTDALSFVISEHINLASEMAKKLVKKEMEK